MTHVAPDVGGNVPNNTEPVPPPVLRDFRAIGDVLADLGSTASALRAPELAKRATGLHLSLLTSVIEFVDRTPEIGEYYQNLGSYLTSLGLEDSKRDDDPRFYEVTVFESIFNVEEEPATDTAAVYLNGKLLTEDEATIVLFEILETATAPLLGPEIRALGLQQYVRASTTLKTGGRFNNIKGKLLEALASHGIEERLIATGKTTSRKYRLDLSGIEVSKTKKTEPEQQDDSTPSPAALPAPTTQPPTASSVAAEVAAGDTPSIDLTATPSGDTAVPKVEHLEPHETLVIRGKTYEFSPLQRRIIDAILAGNHRTPDLIEFLQNGNTYADSEYFGQFLRSIKGLREIQIGDQPLVTRIMNREGEKPTVEYYLPKNARIEFEKKVGNVLRFTDPSTTAGEPHSRAMRRARGTEAADPNAPAAPTELHTRAGKQGTPPKPTPEQLLSTERVKEINDLLPQTRKALEHLLSGTRLTVADLVKEVSGGVADNTLNAIISDELLKAQRLLGSAVLHRKQKSGQAARWWLDEASIDAVRKVLAPTVAESA